jgi:hypothetical protein
MSRPFARLLPGVAMLAIIAGGATAASAAPILIQSGSPGAGQSETCNSSADSSLTTCVDVTPHPAWQPNDPNFPAGSGATDPSSAVWVSFTDTGASNTNSTFQPGGTILTYTYTFMAPPNAQYMGRLWSDNQSTIYLDGMMVGGGSATVGGGSSFGGGGGYAFSGTIGGGGGGGGGESPHIFTVVTHQDDGATDSAGNPGPAVLLDAAINPAEVPEPATLALFGMGLVGAGAIRRKRKQA